MLKQELFADSNRARNTGGVVVRVRNPDRLHATIPDYSPKSSIACTWKRMTSAAPYFPKPLYIRVMLLLPLISLLLQSPAPQSTEIEVRPEGAFYVNQTNNGLFKSPAGQNLAAVSGPRWQQTDSGLAWIGSSAAVGDSGAAAIAGKDLNNEAISCWATGSDTPIFDHSVNGAWVVKAAIADRNNRAAGLVNYDLGGSNFQATVSVWDSSGNGTADWSATMPTTGNVISSTISVSDDGDRIVAAVSSSAGLLHLRVWDRNGLLIGSWDIAAAANMRYGAIDDSGSRFYAALYNGTALIYDLNTGALLHTESIGATFDSHAISGDGKTIAYGTFSGLYVVRETSPGVWGQVAFRANPGSSYTSRATLNQDGTRAGFGVQRYSPAYDHIEVGIFDVTSGLDLNSQMFDAPGTAYQLVMSGVVLNDAGDVLAGCSWGDSLNATPEVFTLDDQGNLLGSVDLPGSAHSVDIDPDGDVVLAGSKAVHANVSGHGGAITCIDAADQTLHMSGYPQLGGSLNLESPAGANALTFSVTTSLGNSMTPFGMSELDIATEIMRVGRTTIPVGGLSRPLLIPTHPSLAGMLVHVQGVRFGTINELTNKVSLRLLP